jgi:Flp pilus assembly protein TadD
VTEGPGQDRWRLRADAAQLLDVGRFDEARQRAGRLVAMAPDDPDALCLLTQALLGGRPDAARDAEAVARRAIAAAPDGEWAHRLLSIALIRQDRRSEAVDVARVATRLAPHHWQAWVQLAMAGGDIPAVRGEAWEAARHAVALAPLEAETHFAMGAVADAVDHAVARTAYREALRLDPGHLGAQNNLALVDLKQKKLLDGARGFVQAGTLDPTSALPAHNLQVTMLALLRRGHLVVWVGYFLLARVARLDSAGTTAVAIGLLWTAVVTGLSVLVWRRVRAMPAAVRHAAWTLATRDRTVAGWAISLALAAVLLAVGLLTGGAHGTVLAIGSWALGLGVVSLLTGVVVSWVAGRRIRRARPR